MQPTYLRHPTAILPDWPGLPAHQIVGERFQSRILPSVTGSLSFIQGDAIFALALGDPLCEKLARALDVKWPKLSEGGFAIVPRPKEKRLFVLGGGKRGLLSGLHWFLERAKWEGDRLEWSHGEMIEEPALPMSYYWTWDHCTNWWLQAEGQQEAGCNNRYTKTADDFVRDYRLLIDHCVRTQIGGLVLWGFCREAHGGMAAAQEICNYATHRGIRIMPGIGTSRYGGAFYVSEILSDPSIHPLNSKSLIKVHPEVARIGADGKSSPLFLCPMHPLTVSWLQECAQWLFGNFSIGGVNIEHGDYFICHCDRCAAKRKGQTQHESLSTLTLSNQPFIDEALRLNPDAWITYATYVGFVPEEFSEADKNNLTRAEPDLPWRIGCKDPEFARTLDPRSVAQWTLTQMVSPKPVPLAQWLDDGKANALLQSEHWPRKITPPTKRNVGLLHQGTQCYETGNHPVGMNSRFTVQLSAIKEACLRATESLVGISIQGEVSPRCIPWDLNYHAFAYFNNHPEASLRQFGRDMLGPLLGGADEGELFVELLAKAETGGCSASDLKKLEEHLNPAWLRVKLEGADVKPYRFWRWLRVAAEPGQWNAAQVYQLTA